MLETIKEKLQINKLVSSKKEIIFVEGETIVPDTKPDVLNTICTSGVVCINKKDVQDERMCISGCVNTYIMYMPADAREKNRGLNTVLDFSEIINMTGVNGNMEGIVKTSVKTIESRVINERKVGIRVGIQVEIYVYQNDEVEIVNDVIGDKSLQMLKQDMKVNSLIGKGSVKSLVKETILVDTIDELAEILKADVNIINKDIKISYNKLLAKAEMLVKIMYLTEDNRINKVSTKIPIVGFVDIDKIMENNICDVTYEIRNILLKPNLGEEHSIYVEAEIEIGACAYEEKSINLIGDMYSPQEEISFNTKNAMTITNKKQIQSNKQIKEKIIFDGLQNKKVIDVDIECYIIKEDRKEASINFECELLYKCMMQNVNMEIECEEYKSSFEYTLDCDTVSDSLNAEISFEIQNKDIIISEGGIINASIDVVVNTNEYDITNINIIDELTVNVEENENCASVVIYITQEGDTLWSIAKKFKSTTKYILESNDIVENDIIPGSKIFIPKYVLNA